MSVDMTHVTADDPDGSQVATADPPIRRTPAWKIGGRGLDAPIGSPATLLHRAAELIEQRGLHRFAWWPDASPVSGDERDYLDGDPCCAVGALAVAAGVWQVHLVQRALVELPALAVANDALHAAMPRGVPFVSAWNDEPSRTAGQVARAMRAVATQLDFDACPGGPSAKTSHRADINTTPNHQDDSKEYVNV